MSLGVLLALTWGCSGSSTDQVSGIESTSLCEDEPAYQLAVLDRKGPLTCGDPAVIGYDLELSSLEEKCKEDRRTLGDQAVVAQQLLDEKGPHYTLLTILQAAHESIPDEAPRMPCADIFASLVVLIGR